MKASREIGLHPRQLDVCVRGYYLRYLSIFSLSWNVRGACVQ
jgi:hypothetical protein